METSSEMISARAAPPLTLTRDFEPSRHDPDHWIAAFERALPSIRRATTTARAEADDRRPPRRLGRAIS